MDIARLLSTFFSETAARKLSMITGIILFTFVTMHLVNHTVLLVSNEAADSALVYFKMVWRHPVAVVLLYGSIAVHFALALRALYLRRYVGSRPLSIVQVVFGLSLPLLIAQHVVSARIPVILSGAETHYSTVVRAIWSDGFFAAKMVLAVIVAWMHGAIGIYAAFNYHKWFQRYHQLLFALAIILPTLALAGILTAGQGLSPVDTASAPRPYGSLELSPKSLEVPPKHDLSGVIRNLYLALGFGGIMILVLRAVRRVREREPKIAITYSHGPVVSVPRGTSILEASSLGQVDHYSVCGGKGRCSTCRVRVLATDGPLPPPTALEISTLKRIKAASDSRLSCQLRPEYNIRVALQLTPPEEKDRLPTPPDPEVGREKDVLVMFSDLRNFTAISESRLPYDIVFLLNSYFAILVVEVEAAGGRVDKYMGDGVMAVFELGQQQPKQVCRSALGAAAKIVTEIRNLNSQLMREFGIELEVAIGMHYGPAIVGVVGYGQVATLTAIGDTVNVASRLEDVAKQFNAAAAVSETVMLMAEVPLTGGSMQRVPLRGRRLDMPVMILTPEQLTRHL